MRIYEEGSDLTFGDFSERDCFHIEKSRLYQKSLSTHGVKTVEFALIHPDTSNGTGKLWLVEARKSFSHQENRFNSNITEISQKFIDSLQMSCSIWLGSHRNKAKLPSNIEDFFKHGGLFRFVLVIKEHDKRELLTIIGEAIKAKLKKEFRIWRFEIEVLDEELAIRRGLVIREAVR